MLISDNVSEIRVEMVGICYVFVHVQVVNKATAAGDIVHLCGLLMLVH